jgi:peptidyl-prolyl cis-trans isomerase A (cyclophilin A)
MTRIHRRSLIAAGLGALAASGLAPRAFAQADGGLVRVEMKTGMGLITLDLNLAKAPITTRNFLRYVDARRFDASTFYRSAHAPGAPEIGVIEGGLRNNPAKIFKPIAHESTIVTGLSHIDGAISMASARPGTATADFFIVVGDQTSFDADPANPTANAGFAAFGHVADGMDVVRAIHGAPVSPHAGPMKGEMLTPPVPILTVRRVTAQFPRPA